ncbi:MAG: rhomboid family intramembrane serine protease [Candidatus Eisenbacteria bacterium]|uniref:Rhomboid family intramembrane serine protease n=1 Tax=Eiseniibacteriota bacterium TaxID=2212470 RepID=A0A937XC37_UNCEI|nr:rhomboid family intramembrane serine protease [Candidatus Eisenbacteria bacterium]
MHAELLHLGFHMLTLWWLGPWLEQEFGRRPSV